MKKATAILPLASLILLTGCDVSWQQVTAAIAVATREPAFAILALSDNNDHESWWDNNDEHFDWAWWPFN